MPRAKPRLQEPFIINAYWDGLAADLGIPRVMMKDTFNMMSMGGVSFSNSSTATLKREAKIAMDALRITKKEAV